VDHILIKHNIKLFLIVTVLPGSLRSTLYVTTPIFLSS
jgi:hypothetical protein